MQHLPGVDGMGKSPISPGPWDASRPEHPELAATNTHN